MWKRTKRLFRVKTDNGGHRHSDSDSANTTDGDSLSSQTITPGILGVAIEPRQSTPNQVSYRKLTQFAADIDAVSNDKAEMHATLVAQMQDVQRLEEKLERASARGARLMAENCRLEAANTLLVSLSAENDEITACLMEMESEKMNMQLALSAAFAATQQYSEPTADKPEMTST